MLLKKDTQWNSVIKNLVVNENLVVTNRFKGQIVHFTTQINPVITNKNGRHEQCVITDFYCI